MLQTVEMAVGYCFKWVIRAKWQKTDHTKLYEFLSNSTIKYQSLNGNNGPRIKYSILEIVIRVEHCKSD